MLRPRSVLRASIVVLVAGFVAIGCGGDDDGDGSGGESAPDTSKVKVGDDKPTGDVSVCIGKDTSGIHGGLLEQFNSENPGAEAALIELPESADEQRTQLVQRLRAKDKECDVLALDVVWTAEFAAQGWLANATDIVDERKDEFIESTLATAEYDDQYFAVPFNSNAGFIYYRTDQAPDGIPETWEDLYAAAGDSKGLTYQGSRYEGLTVHFLELLYSAGGDVLDEDGTASTADDETTREVLQFMVDGVEDGAVPRATLTYKEEEARRAFENSQVTYMRNWPYAYSLGQDTPIKGKFEVAPFPAFGDGEPASVLGGYNLAVSEFSDNPESAAALINYLTAEPAQITYSKAATPSVLTAVYDDASVREALPFADTLRDAIAQGRSRPVSPVYPQISSAIADNVFAALGGDATVDEATKAMDADITKALATF